MKRTNIEIKARSHNHDYIRDILVQRGARVIGTDHQIDTYYKTDHGRLKFRQGTIENTLIAYNRENVSGPKHSAVLLYEPANAVDLKSVLDACLSVLVVVDKRREIFFIDNVKFHLDRVAGLGTFVEIEAISESEDDMSSLHEQVGYYVNLFQIAEDDLLMYSYSDMLLTS